MNDARERRDSGTSGFGSARSKRVEEGDACIDFKRPRRLRRRGANAVAASARWRPGESRLWLYYT